jgi:hypothetical protein
MEFSSSIESQFQRNSGRIFEKIIFINKICEIKKERRRREKAEEISENLERIFKNSNKCHKFFKLFRLHIKSCRVDFNCDNSAIQQCVQLHRFGVVGNDRLSIKLENSLSGNSSHFTTDVNNKLPDNVHLQHSKQFCNQHGP